MLKFFKLIPEGGTYPRGYGAVWRLNYALQVKCCPIPFNILIRALMHWYCAIKHGLFSSKYERDLLNAYFDGLKERNKNA